MATNWWEIGQPVQDFKPVSAEDKKERNWWEIGQPVEEPPKEEVASVQPVVSQEKPTPGTSFEELFGGPITPETAASYKAVSQPPLPAIYDELKRQAIAEGQTSNVLVGGVARSQEILGNLLQGVGRISDVIPEEAYTTSPALGGIKAGLEAISPKLETAAGAFKGEAEKVKYGYGTELKELTDNPLNIVPFVLERFAVSIPDMGAALTAAPAYIVSLTNQSLNDRLKNDGRTYEQATIGDVIAAGSSAMLQAKLEKFATSRLGQAETVLGQTALQGGTEALEEVGQYIAETAGTKAGFDPTTAGLVGLEAGLAGSGIGLVAGGVQDLVQRRIEARIRGNEELGSQIENDMLDEIRKQAFEKAQTIAAPEPNQIPLDEGQTEATPVQYGDAYAQKIYDTIGRYIPINAEFKVEEKTIDGLPQFVVTDKDGVQYGKGLDSRNKADSLALNLNNTTKSRAEIINQLAPLQSSLTESLKGFGLGDIGLSLNNRVFTRRGEALTSEGLFDPVVRRVFLAVDAIDPQGNLDTNQRREALGGVLRHEVVHALRYLDLWKRSEWKNLEKTASTLKKPGTDKTYLQVAQEAYSDQNKVIQVEESVADLIRDVSRNRSKVAGKPRNLSERAINFFDKAKNALTGAGFQTYEDVINRLETGEIGARQRGRIRTFRATEEQQAAQGQLPERVQRLFTNPEERNRFRAEAVQSVQPKTPETPLPAINALRLNAVRESRSTIDPVPPKIRVDEQEVPTRDSEGRLIYSGYEGPEVFGIQTRPTQEGISNFWNWFGKSKEVDKDKRPLVYYHGTAADVTEFKPKQAGSVFITRSPQFAQTFSDLSSEYMISNFPDFMNDQEVLNILTESMRSPTTPSFYDKLEKVQKRASDSVGSNQPFSGELIQDIKKLFRGSGKSSYMAARIQSRLPSNANIVPVYVKAENPFDYENPEHIKKVLKKIDETSVIELDSGQIEGLKKGDWTAVESPVILNAIKNLGFDSMYVEEMDEKNLAVFNPNQIKSAVGNNGDFSPITPSIRESRKPIYNIINRITGQVVGKAATIAGANRVVDRKDNEYGSYVHTIQVLDEEADIRESNRQREKINAIIRQQGGTEIPAVTKPGGYNKQLPGATYGIKAPVSPLTLPITPSIKESRVAKPRQILFEVAPDPNNQPLTEAWRGLDPSVRLTISERVAKNIVPMVLDASGARGTVVGQVGSYGEDTNPSFALMLERGDPLDIAKSIGFALSQDSMMVVAPNKFNGGDVVQSVTVNLGQKSPQEVESIYNSLREIEVDGNKPVGGQTFANGFMTILNYSDVKTDTLADLIDKKLNGEYNVLVTDVYSAFPEKKDYDYASPENDGTGKRADLRQRLRGLRAEASDSVQRELQGLATQGGAAAPAEAVLIPTARESRIPRSSVSIFEMPDEEAKQTLGLEPGKNITRFVGERLNQRTLDEFGRIEDTDTSDSAAKQIADAMVTEVLYQLQASAQTGTGIGWYSNNYPRAVRRLARRFPELETDPNARSLFTAIVAITSNGEDVKQNISNAIKIYSGARKGQRLSKLSVSTRRSDSLRDNLKVLDTLIERYGIDGFSSILLEEMTVGEINAELRKLDEKTDSAYTADTVMPRAALYFGPKLGAFYSNLMGAEGYLTMDLWWSRMFNRLRGTLVPKPTQSSLDNVRGMLISIGRLPPSFVTGIKRPTDDDVIEAAVPFWESAKRKGYKRTTALEKAANTLIKAARLELEEAPFRASDRGFMIRTTRLAQDQLRNRGINLSLADIQAALWYYEKRLYGKLTGRATDDIGYEEAILNAAEGARPERSPPRFYRGSGRGAVSRGTGEAARRVVPTEAEIIPAAREARRRGTPIGPTQPGPENDTDNTSAAEALNNGQPVDRIGAPSGPTISDTMPDGTVDVSRSRIAPLTRRLVVQMIQSAPDKLRSGFGLDDLAKRIENYYDTYASRLGVANSIIRDAFKRIDLGGRTAALDTFEQFIRARENNRTEEAQAILDAATDSERQLIDAWNQIAIQTGEINTSLRTPDGKPMRVWDAKRGEWRPIRSVRNFFPRTFRREVMEVMQNPDLDPVLWQSLLDSLVAAGRAETTQDAEKYLLREWFSDEVTQDYFAGVEKARNEPLPEIFYDYSWDAATRYIRKWSRRTAQIENFGQTLGTFQKEWFDANIPKVRDQETQNYLNAIKERIYEIEQFNALTNMANWFNSLATGLMLGNWVSASLNLLGGTITNVQEFGIKEIGKSYIDLVRYWKNVQEEGTTLGILNKDFLNILNDHVEMDADKYFSREQKISQGLAKFTNVMLNVGLFNSAENVVRSSALLAAHSRLNKFLRDVNEGRETKQVQAFREWVKRENLDIDALILENGAGKETERFMRRAVNVPQGSYNIDMTPVFIDTGAGRFLLKYQKFGTQINRFFYNHFLKPFYDKPNQKNFMRIAAFLGTAIVGGGAIIAIREALGYGDPGPDDEEIKKAFENEDTARAWGLIFSRAWQNIMAAGSLGFFANYAQFAVDWQDQQRVKNPFSPPGLASVDAVIDVFNRLRDQGKLTARDLDEIAETTVSFYRAGKRTTLAAMDAMGSDAREVRRFAAQKELREVREYGRRYSEVMEIEFKRSTAPGAPIRTPMTPTNKAITDALHQGDAARARLLIREALQGLRAKEKEKVKASISAAVRNRQPIQIGGNAPSQQERAAFMRWARQNLPAEKYQMIRRADLRYKRAAARAGVGFGD